MHLFVVGKLNNKEIEKLENDYLKRLQNPTLKIHELKSHSENLKKEASEIQAKLGSLYKNAKPYIILMTETGSRMDSPKFSNFLSSTVESFGDKIVFIIGGAAGFSKDILEMADYKLSLSPLTFPHKLARLLLVEQIYRGQMINIGHPYHK